MISTNTALFTPVPAVPVVGSVVLAPATALIPAPAAPIPVSTRANSTTGFQPKRRGRPSGVATVLLPAGQSRTLDEEGDRFTILSTNLPVLIQPNGGREEKYYTGLTGRFSDPFTFLRIKNPSTSSALTLVIWVGFEDLANYQAALLPTQPVDNLSMLSASNTTQPASAVDLYFRKGWLYAYMAISGSSISNNAANINIGKLSTRLPDVLTPGSVLLYEAPDGQLFNLAKIYFSGTTGDGLYFVGS